MIKTYYYYSCGCRIENDLVSNWFKMRKCCPYHGKLYLQRERRCIDCSKINICKQSNGPIQERCDNCNRLKYNNYRRDYYKRTHKKRLEEKKKREAVSIIEPIKCYICRKCGTSIVIEKGKRKRKYCDKCRKPIYLNRIKELRQSGKYRYINHRSKPLSISGEELNKLTVMTLEQVSDKLGITRERVRQIEASAFHKLKRSIMNNPVLREYVTEGFTTEDELKKHLVYRDYIS